MQPNPMVLTSIDCPTCGRKMGIRTASAPVFSLGCSGYALPPRKSVAKPPSTLVPENEVPQRCWKAMTRETNALRAKRRCQEVREPQGAPTLSILA